MGERSADSKTLRYVCDGHAGVTRYRRVRRGASPHRRRLELVKVKRIDKLYKRPGASLSGYTKILLKPIEVAFSKSWNPRDYRTFGLKSDEVEEIRRTLAALANKTSRETLTNAGYVFVTAPEAGVLEVDAGIVDLFINAPDTMDAGRTRTYVMNAGEKRLAATLRDAVTGTTLTSQ